MDQLLLKRLVLLKDGGNDTYCFWLLRSALSGKRSSGGIAGLE
nr:hypothetical protein Q903MT_gene891 [Picea sitchensis]